MHASTYLRMARRWAWLIAIATLLGAAAAFFLTGLVAPTYRATATLLVVQQPEQGAIQRADLETSALMANTFSEMVPIGPIIVRASQEMGGAVTAGEIARSLEVQQVERTQLIRITASHSDPVLARDIANTVSQVFIDSPEAALLQGTAIVSIVEPAVTPSAPVSPQRSLNTALGALLAFVVCGGLIALFEYFDNTVKRPHQVLDLTGLPTLGRLSRFPRPVLPGDRLEVALHPQSPASEGYRSMRTNLLQALLPREEGGFERQVVLFTSPNVDDGKSTTLANVALVLGLAGHQTLVVDSDLRKPSMHSIFSIGNSEGLTTLLLNDRASLEQVIQPTAHRGVWVLPSGPIPANPADLLGSPRMRALLQEFREEFDIVLLDTPPAVEVTDASVLATLADSVVIVTHAGKTRAQELRAAVAELAGSGCAIAGVVLNRTRERDRAEDYREHVEDRQYPQAVGAWYWADSARGVERPGDERRTGT